MEEIFDGRKKIGTVRSKDEEEPYQGEKVNTLVKKRGKWVIEYNED